MLVSSQTPTPEAAALDQRRRYGIGANVFWEGFDASGNGTLDKVKEDYDFGGGGGYFVEVYPSWETESDIIRIKMSHNPTITNNRAGDIIATQYS